MPVAPPAQYGIDCAIARRGNTRNSGHGYCQKGQYAVLGAAIACSNTPLFAPIAPAGAIGLGLRYCPTGQYAQFGARLLPKRAIRRAWRGYCLQQYAALCAYCAGWRNRTRVALLPDGAIRATWGTAIAQKGNTPRQRFACASHTRASHRVPLHFSKLYP